MTRRAQVQQPSMFAEPPKPPAPLPVRLCACGAVGCYGLGPPAVPAQNEQWFCGDHLPPGFWDCRDRDNAAKRAASAT